jgi:hypothetical protein
LYIFGKCSKLYSKWPKSKMKGTFEPITSNAHRLGIYRIVHSRVEEIGYRLLSHLGRCSSW